MFQKWKYRKSKEKESEMKNFFRKKEINFEKKSGLICMPMRQLS